MSEQPARAYVRVDLEGPGTNPETGEPWRWNHRVDAERAQAFCDEVNAGEHRALLGVRAAVRE